MRDVLDPEVGIDIVDLGLIKDITISDDGKVAVNMVLTSQICPMVSHLTEQIRRRVEGLQGVREVEEGWTSLELGSVSPAAEGEGLEMTKISRMLPGYNCGECG